MKQNWFVESQRRHYDKRIREERWNFFFLTDNTMFYDYEHFGSYVDAMIDAVVNHNEDLDDMISLVFPEKIDHPIVKKKMLKLIEEYKNKK